ncbi:MAG: DNA translocase FtsK 4TM domain-containing protein, partial [Solirubrobacterales bacterium]
MFVRSSRRNDKKRPSKSARKPKSKQEVLKVKEPLDQRHLDLIGLGCVALGIYLVFVLYFGWDGGRLGSGIRDGLQYMIGLAAYAIPVALFAVGAVLIFKPSMPSTRPLRTGAACLLAGLLLAFAAGTFGLGGGRADNLSYFDPGWFPEHGGVIGESMYWLLATLLQPFGAHLVATFALIAGVLLLTGTTVAAFLTRSGTAIKKAGATSAEATRVFSRANVMSDEETVVSQTADEDQTQHIFDPVTGEIAADSPASPPFEDATAEIELPQQERSPVEVDIWADEGDEPTISGKTEKLEPIEIFAGANSAGTPVAEPETADGGFGGDWGGDSGDDSGEPDVFTDDFDQELADLEEEFDVPEVELEETEERVVDPAAIRAAEIQGKKVEQLELTPMGEKRGATTAKQVRYRPPTMKILDRGSKDTGPDPVEQKELARKLVETLGHFGVEAKIVGVVSGPHVSRFELQLAPGTKVKKVSELSNDLAYALASTDIRILAPIPGKQAVGVEVPNSSRNMVKLGDIYSKPSEKASPLVAWLGKGIDGKSVCTDLATMPHVLVAGTTGSGKSGCVNAILSSILMHSSPNDVRLVLVDPKQVELNHYEAVPHLLTPVVTAPKLAANVLQNLIAEMETRYGLMKSVRARNIADYNK